MQVATLQQQPLKELTLEETQHIRGAGIEEIIPALVSIATGVMTIVKVVS